jgi:hypothetical protein
LQALIERVHAVAPLVASRVSDHVQSTIGSGQDALGLDMLPHIIALELGFVLSTAYFSAAQAALFDQIVAHQDSSRPS